MVDDEVLEKLVKLGYKQPIKKKRIEVEIVEWIRLHKGIIILVYPFTNKEGEKRFIFAIPMENGSLSSNNLNYPSYEQARLEGIKSVCNVIMKKLLIIISLIIGLVSCVSKRKDLPQYKVEYSKELVIKSIDRGLNSYGVSTIYYIAGDEIGSNGDIRLSERISSSNTPTYKIGDKILFSIKKIEKNK